MLYVCFYWVYVSIVEKFVKVLVKVVDIVFVYNMYFLVIWRVIFDFDGLIVLGNFVIGVDVFLVVVNSVLYSYVGDFWEVCVKFWYCGF